MATAVAPDVGLATEVLTVGEVQNAARLAVAGLGLTLNQLQDQARRGQFSSERARLVWIAIRDVARTT
jgi:hypothetical protein